MKSKILFFGNCHLSAIAEWLHKNYSDKFEVIDCEECGVERFWISSKNFAIWAPNNVNRQQEFYKKVHQKIKEADIFVFHSISGTTIIDELKTKYVHDCISKGLKICAPNVRFSAYPVCAHTLKPYLEYIFNNITKDQTKILEYICHEQDSKFHEILYSTYPLTQNSDVTRVYNIQSYEDNLKNYPVCINLNPFIEKNWKNKRLFASFNHPSGFYYEELIKQLFLHIGETFDIKKVQNIVYPGSIEAVNPLQFLFFKTLFPNITTHVSQSIKYINVDYITKCFDYYTQKNKNLRN